MSTLVQNPAKRKARRIANFIVPAETPQIVVEPTSIVEVVMPALAPAPKPALTGALAELLAYPVPASTCPPMSHLALKILSELFYSESVLNEAQLRIIRGELREQTNFSDGTL